MAFVQAPIVGTKASRGLEGPSSVLRNLVYSATLRVIFMT
jgi:hypothetical protein